MAYIQLDDAGTIYDDETGELIDYHGDANRAAYLAGIHRDASEQESQWKQRKFGAANALKQIQVEKKVAYPTGIVATVVQGTQPELNGPKWADALYRWLDDEDVDPETALSLLHDIIAASRTYRAENLPPEILALFKTCIDYKPREPYVLTTPVTRRIERKSQ